VREGWSDAKRVENVCWTMQYNTFNVTFPFPNSADFTPPEQELKETGGPLKKIDQQPNNACIQFFDVDGETAITPIYEAKYYKTKDAEDKEEAVVYVDWRYVRPGQGDLRVNPLSLFSKSAGEPKITKDSLLNFSRASEFDVSKNENKYVFPEDVAKNEFAEHVLKAPRNKSWSKGVFLAVYETIFREQSEAQMTAGHCAGYVAPKSSKRANTLFDDTYCVFFDLRIMPIQEDRYHIRFVLTAPARQKASRSESCEGKGERTKKTIKEAKATKADDAGKPGEEKLGEETPAKKKQKKSVKEGTNRADKEQRAEEPEKALDIIFKQLTEASKKIESDPLATTPTFSSLEWKYHPRAQYTITINDGNPEDIYAKIKAMLDGLEEKEYAAKLKDPLGGKKIYELTPQERNYKYALDALLSLWLSNQTQNQDLPT